MPISDWSAATLCLDTDCIAEETRVLNWNDGEGMSKWRGQAKDNIGDRLRHMLRQQTVDMDIDIETDDILNHIMSYEPLRQLAVYMTIHLLSKNMIINPGDLYDQKSRDYYSLFGDEWTRAVEMLHLDTDESGTIDNTEKFNVVRDIKFIRGG